MLLPPEDLRALTQILLYLFIEEASNFITLLRLIFEREINNILGVLITKGSHFLWKKGREGKRSQWHYSSNNIHISDKFRA